MRSKLLKGGALVKHAFTLIELLVAMAVFSILMFAMMSLFGSAQKVWTSASGKTEMFENARMALDMITRDLQCSYYVYDTVNMKSLTPFWHANGATNDYSEMLAFPTSTQRLPNSNCISRLVEVKYAVDKMGGTISTTDKYWLKVSYTGDRTALDPNTPNAKWNFYGDTMYTVGTVVTGAGAPYTVNEDSSDPWVKLIPYVIDMSFKCLDKDGNEVTAVNLGSWKANKLTLYPYSVEITLTMLDQPSFKKWQALGGSLSHPMLEKNKRVFTRRVILGDRGQY